MIIGAKATRATDQRGTENETADELHGQHHSAVIINWMYGHCDQTVEWGTLYFKKKSLAYDQCFDEVKAQDPVMAKFNKTEAEDAEFSRRVKPCMERKGY